MHFCYAAMRLAHVGAMLLFAAEAAWGVLAVMRNRIAAAQACAWENGIKIFYKKSFIRRAIAILLAVSLSFSLFHAALFA